MAKFPFAGEALKSLFKSPLTNKDYKKEACVPENYRGIIEFNPEVCIGCGLCMRVCSPGAISKSVKKVEEGQEITMSFDMSSCTFCGLCSDFCAKKAIHLGKKYSIVLTEGEELIISGTAFRKIPAKKVPPKKVPDK